MYSSSSSSTSLSDPPPPARRASRSAFHFSTASAMTGTTHTHSWRQRDWERTGVLPQTHRIHGCPITPQLHLFSGSGGQDEMTTPNLLEKKRQMGSYYLNHKNCEICLRPPQSSVVPSCVLIAIAKLMSTPLILLRLAGQTPHYQNPHS